MNNIGFTQGRLLGDTKIQAFPIEWESELKLAKKIGIKKIEWLFDENYLDNPLYDIKKRNFISGILKKNSIKISSLCLDNFLFTKFTLNKKNIFFIKKIIIDICQQYKIKKIVIPLLKKSKTSKEHLCKNKDWFILINHFLKKNKIFLCFENDLSPRENYEFMNTIDSDNIGLTFDMGNSAYWGFNQEIEIELLRKYIKHVHIKDCTPKNYSVKFGKGNVNFKLIFDTLRKHKFNGDYILQGYRLKNNLKAVKDQLNFIRKFDEYF